VRARRQKGKNMKWHKVNLNDHIKFQINESGMRHYREHFRNLGFEVATLKPDENGYITMQIHYFMHLFGDLMIATLDPPCVPDVLIESDDDTRNLSL
jgi:hypothetical protein